jgi:primosomal protein N'
MLTPASRRSGEVAQYLMLQHFPLTNAYLCQDCNSIGNSAKRCPACASEVLMSLATVLNRVEDEMTETRFPSMPAMAAVSTLSESALAA